MDGDDGLDPARIVVEPGTVVQQHVPAAKVVGNLIGIEPDPKKIKMGMAVETVYKLAPRKDREGNEYLTYYFQPAKA